MGWYVWLEKELENRGFKAHTLFMPNPDEPEIEPWIACLEKTVGTLNENTYFVGHSVGCQTILRYISRNSSARVGGVVCVAGWFVLKDLESENEWEVARPWLVPRSLWDITRPFFKEEWSIAKKWLDERIPLDKLDGRLNLVAIFSDNDPYVPVEPNKTMFENIGAKTIVLPKMCHLAEDDYDELPVVLEELLEMIK